MRAVIAPPLDLEIPDVIACKCCGGEARLCGTADFARSCVDAWAAAPFASAGIAVPYHRCTSCAFLFTAAFDRLAPEAFAEHVYNDDYVLADPDFTGLRANARAQWMAKVFPAAKGRRLLDYGGGDGTLAANLRAMGYAKCTSYDPFHLAAGGRPAGRFEIVTSFEVVEHSPAPLQVMKDLRWFMDDESLLVFSTLLQPADIEHDPMRWWYVAPRNGHVSLHSRRSLDVVMERVGLSWGSFDEGTHVAFRKRPPRFAAHIFT